MRVHEGPSECSKVVRYLRHGFNQTLLTTQLSNDAANSPEVETSSANPQRFFRMSCSFSRFVRGGGRWRLSCGRRISSLGRTYERGRTGAESKDPKAPVRAGTLAPTRVASRKASWIFS